MLRRLPCIAPTVEVHTNGWAAGPSDENEERLLRRDGEAELLLYRTLARRLAAHIVLRVPINKLTESYRKVALRPHCWCSNGLEGRDKRAAIKRDAPLAYIAGMPRSLEGFHE